MSMTRLLRCFAFTIACDAAAIVLALLVRSNWVLLPAFALMIFGLCVIAAEDADDDVGIDR